MGKGKGDLFVRKKKSKRLNVCVCMCVHRCEGVYVGMEEGHNKMLRAGWSQKGHWPMSPIELHKWC